LGEAEHSAAGPLPGRPIRWVKQHGRVLAVAVFALSALLTRSWEGDLHGDPVRYASVSLSILQTGDWLIMHNAPGVIYTDKPPLMFWLVATSYRLFGVGTYAAKVWSCLFAIGACVLTYLLGKRLFGPTAGLLAGAMLAVTPGLVINAVDLRMDSSVMFYMVLAALAVVRADAEDRPRWLLLAGLAAGLAVMTKSAAGALVGLLLLVRRPRFLIHPYLFGAVALALLVALPWHVHEMFWNKEKFAERYLGAQIEDRLVLGWHIPANVVRHIGSILLRGLPWTPLALLALVRRRRLGHRELASGRTERWGMTLALVWAAEVIVLMAVAPRPYDRYLIPAYPAIMLLAGLGLDQLLSPRARAAAPAVVACLGVASTFLLAVVPVKLHTYQSTGFVHARDLLDTVTPGTPLAVYDPTVPPESSRIYGSWVLCSKTNYYLRRPLRISVSEEELLAASPRFVMARNQYAEPLRTAGYEKILDLDGTYQLFERHAPPQPPLR